MRRFACCAVLLCGALASCTHIPRNLDVDKPVQTNRGFVHPAFEQDGEYVSFFDATSKLGRFPETSPYVRRSRVLFWSGMTASTAGGVVMVDSLANYDHRKQIPFSLGLLGAGIVLEYWSRLELINGAELHNRSLGEVKPTARLRPFIAPFADGAPSGDRLGLQAGFSGDF